MIPAFIAGTVVATYAHKSFPRQTEAVARAVVVATGWSLRKCGELLTSIASGSGVTHAERSGAGSSTPRAIEQASSTAIVKG
jgi:hypothetical protein